MSFFCLFVCFRFLSLTGCVFVFVAALGILTDDSTLEVEAALRLMMTS